LDSSAPRGAKLRLFGVCDQLDGSALFIGNGIVVYGKCDFYTNINRSPETMIGTLRYMVDAAYAGSSMMQFLSTSRFFVGSSFTHQVIMSSSAIIQNPDGPYFISPTTFMVSKVVIDQGLGSQYVDDCNFSRFSRMVLSFDDPNSPNVNFTFF
jgi:hypothetical protein